VKVRSQKDFRQLAASYVLHIFLPACGTIVVRYRRRGQAKVKTIEADARLAKAASAGDKEAFATLVDRHYRRVYGLAYSTVGDWSAAEEITQEAFLVAYTNLAKLRKPGVFLMWLRRIVRNLCAHWVRSEVYRRKLAERLSAQREERGDKQDDPAAAILCHERHSEVWDALRALSPNLREAMVLYYMEGNSTSEAARALGVTENAVRTRLYQGRKKMREYLEGRVAAELRRPAPEQAKKRILTALALGPAVPHVGTSVSGAGLGMWAHHLLHGGASAVFKPVFVGGSVMSIKKTSIIVATALLVGTGVYLGTRRLSDAPAGPSRTPLAELKPLASGSEFSADPAIPAVESPSAAPQKPAGKTEIEPGRARVVARPIPEPPKDSTDVLETEPGTIEDPADYCSISGFVMDEEGNGLPGAEIIVLATGYASEQPLFDRTARATLTNRNHLFAATTGREGEYEVTGIKFSGVARVSAHAEGYVAGSGSRVTLLVPGVAKEGVDFILSEGVTLRGSVLTSDRAPVTDAVVEVLGYATRGSSGGVRHFTNTDADGRFSLGFPGEGVCTLQVASDAHGQRIFAQVPISDKEVELIMEQEGTATLAGRITWSDGTPAQDLIVSVRGQWSVRTEGGTAGGPASEYRALVDAEGYYEIAEIDSGSITYAATVLSPPTDPAALHTFLSPQTDLGTFEPGETRVWDYVVQECMTVKGHVYGEYTRRPLMDVRVCWLKGQPPIEGRDVGVGSDGSYEARLLAGPGTYFIYPRCIDNSATKGRRRIDWVWYNGIH
jgi:RNA polymerase sigma factor (sigma-70 family)